MKITHTYTICTIVLLCYITASCIRYQVLIVLNSVDFKIVKI